MSRALTAALLAFKALGGDYTSMIGLTFALNLAAIAWIVQPGGFGAGGALPVLPAGFNGYDSTYTYASLKGWPPI